MYDFRSLSAQEFEALSRDLLQEQLGVALESFAPGPDEGMDLRLAGPVPEAPPEIIGQCKHVPDASAADLLRLLRRELTKVRRLSPKRYVLTTSARLSPGAKSKIIELLSPYVCSTGDVFGASDLNGLLARFPDVERRHFKLWLTSPALLARLLQSSTFLDTALAIESIRERLARYVPNESYHEAVRRLDDQRFCVITGDPGIGKTTLAEVLLVGHVDAGYEAIRVSNNLSEVRGQLDPERRVVFYFDDFLGKTGLDKLQQNEDERLVELMRRVARTPNWRFILTTRDYILSAARERYESLSHLQVDLWKCVIDLTAYTAPVRARILYNHVYFSALSDAHKLALLESPALERIVSHQNYSPRVVEHMTDPMRVGVATSAYPEEFLSNLDNPQRVWSHAFSSHISDAARTLLLSLVPADDLVPLEDASAAFWRLRQVLAARYGAPAARGDDFERALKELDGSFLRTDLGREGIVVRFRNPSVRDFLEATLWDHPRYVLDLVEAADTPDELERLWRGRRGQRFPAVARDPTGFLSAFLRTAAAKRAAVEQPSRETAGARADNWTSAREAHRNLALVGEVSREFSCPPGEADLDELVADYLCYLSLGFYDPDDLGEIATLITEQAFPGQGVAEPLFAAVKRQILGEFEESLEGFAGAMDFVKHFRAHVTEAELAELRYALTREFAGLVATALQSPSSHEMRSAADQLEALSGFFSPYGFCMVDEVDALAELRAAADARADDEARPRQSGGSLLDTLSDTSGQARASTAGPARTELPPEFVSAFASLRHELRARMSEPAEVIEERPDLREEGPPPQDAP